MRKTIALLLFVLMTTAGQAQDLIPYRAGDKWGFCSRNGKTVIPAMYDQVGEFREGIVRVTLEKLSGYYDRMGNPIAAVKYYEANDFSEGYARIATAYYPDRWPRYDYGYIDREGQELCVGAYTYAGDFKEGVACVRDYTERRRPGYIDRNFKLIISTQYKNAWDFHDGLALVQDEGSEHLGFIDLTGREVVPAKYWNYCPVGPSPDDLRYRNGFVTLCQDNHLAYVDRGGRAITPFIYDSAHDFSEGRAVIELNSLYGALDESGMLVIALKYGHMEDFRDGRALVNQKNKWGYIDRNGKTLVPLLYDKLDRFSEGCAAFLKGGRSGYVDPAGKEIFLFSFGWTTAFQNNFAVVAREPPFSHGTIFSPPVDLGFIDRAGRQITGLKYQNALPFTGGRAAVQDQNGKWGFIDETGKEVVRPSFTEVGAFSEGRAYAVRNGRYGFIDLTGKEVIPLKYDGTDGLFQGGIVRVVLDGKPGYINRDGTEYWEGGDRKPASSALAFACAVTGSSALTEKSDLNMYRPARAFDGRPDTGWMEAAKGAGVGEWIEIVFDRPVTADRLRVSPGWFDKRYWAGNNRVKVLAIELDGEVIDASFADKMAAQEVTFPAARTFTRARFTIKDVYRSGRDDDACLAEIEFWNAGKKVGIDISGLVDQLRTVRR